MKLFQIYEEGLAALEQLCPEILHRSCANLDNAMRVKFRQIQNILMNVRWNHGPPTHVESFPADRGIPEATT